ncbi:MAG: alpha/beta fold hydrolase [Bacteroidota bacterium]
MPVLTTSSYRKAPFYQWTGNLQTILPSLLRSIEGVQYERERLILSDGDFVDLDWIDNGQRRLVILTHGLEGNSQRHYIRGAAKFFSQQKWDILAWNCRSCSGEMNRGPRLYNHGEIEDFTEVVNHAATAKDYQQIVLIGYSMGGSITLKYLGVQAARLPEIITHGIAFSSPCYLKPSADSLNRWSNWIYKKRFLQMLSEKMRKKAAQFPNLIDPDKLDQVDQWRDFDEHFSAPLSGFETADAFYEYASAANFMSTITIPVLLVNTQNDPIIPPACTPVQLCQRHPSIFLEQPKVGGHIGFMTSDRSVSWMETRAMDFINGKR